MGEKIREVREHGEEWVEVDDGFKYASQGEWARAYMALDGWESTGLPLVGGD